MRHYLNTDLKGKTDFFGLQRYSVYVMFTVNRQTFKIKSRILRKMFSIEEFDRLIKSESAFISKDQEIIRYCIEETTENDLLNIEAFKSLYASCCTSIILWLEDIIINERQHLMDDFFFGSDVQLEAMPQNPLSDIEQKYRIDRRNVLGYLNHYATYTSKKPGFNKYMLAYDWVKGDLKKDFIEFLKDSSLIPSKHSDIIGFIDSLISLI